MKPFTKENLDTAVDDKEVPLTEPEPEQQGVTPVDDEKLFGDLWPLDFWCCARRKMHGQRDGP